MGQLTDCSGCSRGLAPLAFALKYTDMAETDPARKGGHGSVIFPVSPLMVEATESSRRLFEAHPFSLPPQPRSFRFPLRHSQIPDVVVKTLSYDALSLLYPIYCALGGNPEIASRVDGANQTYLDHRSRWDLLA